jgi:hypothetical protein
MKLDVPDGKAVSDPNPANGESAESQVLSGFEEMFQYGDKPKTFHARNVSSC